MTRTARPSVDSGSQSLAGELRVVEAGQSLASVSEQDPTIMATVEHSLGSPEQHPFSSSAPAGAARSPISSSDQCPSAAWIMPPVLPRSLAENHGERLRCGQQSQLRFNESILPPVYPRDLEIAVVFSDGARYSLRPIRPDDAAPLVEFHEHLSHRSTYLRFFTVHPTLSAGEVERFTSVDYVDRLALVVETEGKLIAVGRFDRHVGTAEAEVAFVVADDYSTTGSGRSLA